MADKPPEWLDGAEPPPYKEKGSIWKKTAGLLHPDTPVAQIKEIGGMPGVETNTVEADETITTKVDVNGITLPKK